MVKHEHSLLPYRFGERDLNVLLRNWRRLGVGMEGRNCRQPSACLPASSTTLLHPIPSPYPTFYIPEALIQTRFVNIDVRSALRSCKFSLSPFYPLFHVHSFSFDLLSQSTPSLSATSDKEIIAHTCHFRRYLLLMDATRPQAWGPESRFLLIG